MTETQRSEIEVEEESRGERLDRLVAERLQRSRTYVQGEISAHRILVDGRPARPATRLDGGEVVTVLAPPEDPSEDLMPEDLPLDVLWQDEDLAIVNKPAGLAVHPGAGRATGTLCHRLIARYPEIVTVGSAQRPGIVHRLDLGTSGVMVVARTEPSYRALVEAFARRRVAKEYVAIAHGGVDRTFTLDLPIGRHPVERKRMTVLEGGRPARTDGERLDLAARDRLSLLLLRLHTGRTHQIRVHLKDAGHPLVGDPVYGEARWKELTGSSRIASRRFARPALHAWRLTLQHPRSEELHSWCAPLPADLRALWIEVGGREPTELLDARAAPDLGDLDRTSDGAG